MALGPGLQLKPTQQLVMSQQLQAAIKLLALSNLELESVIAEEMSKNPLLEVKSSDGSERSDTIVGEDRDTGDEASDPAGSDELIGAMGGNDDQPLDMDMREAALDTDSYTDLSAPDDQGFDFERLSSEGGGLEEHLLGQLAGTGGTIGRVAEAIVNELEETGYLETSLEIIAEGTETPLAEVKEALALVQSLEPPGIAARSLEECIALQAKAADRYDPAMARLIDNLHLLAKGRMKDLKRICGVDEEDLADMVVELRAYDPKPGCRFEPEGTPAAGEPDVIVTQTKEGWSVQLNPANLPRVLVNRQYHAELKAGRNDKQSRKWLSECLASASWLVRALDQRAQTITKVATEIVKRQKDFFEKGVEALKPLTLREVADAIEMHESTVSRVTQNKNILCERGVFEMKYFFGSGVSSDSGEGAAAEAVKAEIKRLIDNEDKILSDDALVKELKEKGYDLARRTVAKYREAMGIGSSVQRRRQRKMAGGG